MNVLSAYQIVAVALLGLGLFGLIFRRTLVGMLISVELMLSGAGLSVVAASQLTPASAELGQIATLIIMGLAAAEATLVLAIIVVVSRRYRATESDLVSLLKG